VSGTECITANDTIDADYGELLERAYGKGWRPQRDSTACARRLRFGFLVEAVIEIP